MNDCKKIGSKETSKVKKIIIIDPEKEYSKLLEDLGLGGILLPIELDNNINSNICDDSTDIINKIKEDL